MLGRSKRAMLAPSGQVLGARTQALADEKWLIENLYSKDTQSSSGLVTIPSPYISTVLPLITEVHLLEVTLSLPPKSLLISHWSCSNALQEPAPCKWVAQTNQEPTFPKCLSLFPLKTFFNEDIKLCMRLTGSLPCMTADLCHKGFEKLFFVF
jgi:hypothetical protein